MIKQFFEIFSQANVQIYLIGGSIRDFCVKQLKNKDLNPLEVLTYDFCFTTESDDFDFAVSSTPEETLRILKDNGYHPFDIGKEFGTIGVFIEDTKFEFTTFRSSESYTKGSRKPTVKWGKTIQEDLARRDLTINSMAVNIHGEIIDPFNGLDHLKKGILTTPSNTHKSFSDDPLRMLRVARFASRGLGLPSFDTQCSMVEMAHLVKTLSAERIFSELTKILVSDYPEIGMTILCQTQIMKHILPSVFNMFHFNKSQGQFHHKNVWEHTMQVVRNCPQDNPTLRWSAFLHDIGKPHCHSETETGIHFYEHDLVGKNIWRFEIAPDLKVSNDFKEDVSFFIENHMTVSLFVDQEPKDKAIRRFITRCGHRLEELFILSRADITSHNPIRVKERLELCDKLEERVKRIAAQEEIVKIRLPSGLGNVLMDSLKIYKKELGKVMKELEQRLIDGDITKDCDFVEESRKILKEWEQK